jgi:hypothetical protein
MGKYRGKGKKGRWQTSYKDLYIQHERNKHKS